MRYGLLGRKLGHSYSPQIHKYFGNKDYDLFEIEPESLENFMQASSFKGINVTIPYKKEVIAYCDSISAVAQQLGAVNTIIRKQDNTLWGHNTDYFGFQYMLKKSGLSVKNKKVLVLGSGGASVTVKVVLEDHGAKAIVISRSGADNYSNLDKHLDASVIVNATPVGMYPHNGLSPIDINIFPALEGVLDLIYNPHRTKLILDAQKRGLVTLNGLWMLVAQAYEAAKLFTGQSIDEDKIVRIYDKINKQTQNRIFIGMPGSGKSTLGKLYAEATGRDFVDADTKIEEYAQLSIPEIFSQYGEGRFRQIESDVLKELGKCSGLVIATGGGCVTRPKNYAPLHQNGIIIWVRRNVHDLPTNGRPLSQKADLTKMYKSRKPLYAQFSDWCIDNDGDISQALQQIMKLEERI